MILIRSDSSTTNAEFLRLEKSNLSPDVQIRQVINPIIATAIFLHDAAPIFSSITMTAALQKLM